MDVVQLLGRNVRHYRKLRGLTQEQLAHEVEMERSYVSDLERGVRNPSVKALGRLADALSIEPHTLLMVRLEPDNS
jgi:transcriptional regulator with XRE-family HTH domain